MFLPIFISPFLKRMIRATPTVHDIYGPVYVLNILKKKIFSVENKTQN